MHIKSSADILRGNDNTIKHNNKAAWQTLIFYTTLFTTNTSFSQVFASYQFLEVITPTVVCETLHPSLLQQAVSGCFKLLKH